MVLGSNLIRDFIEQVDSQAINGEKCQSNAQVNAKKGGKNRKNDKK